MPGSVANATFADVLPFNLARSYKHVREYAIVENTYPDGSRQARLEVQTSRKRWELAEKLTAAAMASMRDFYSAHNGPHEPFWFYYFPETSPPGSWDPTGVATAGRYGVRFADKWQQSIGLGRGDAEFGLIEVG